MKAITCREVYSSVETLESLPLPGAPAFSLPSRLCKPVLVLLRLLLRYLPWPCLYLLVNNFLHRHWDTGEQCGKPLQFGQEGAQHLSNGHHTTTSCFYVELLKPNGGGK